MAKQLLVMRHAKSSWEDSRMTDFQRPLNERGLRDAPRMAEFLFSNNVLPSYIASSTAERARQTTELFLNNCPASGEIEFVMVDEFYLAPARIYLKYLMELKDEGTDIVMLVGHNPGLEELVQRLSGQFEHLPTAAVARFTFEVDSWQSISADNCQLVALWRPKDVPG